jgi:hypothetical protein
VPIDNVELTPVASSNLDAVGYESASAETDEVNTLYIRFASGPTYAYYNVPQDVYEGLMSAASKGEYFHYNIRDRFSYNIVG